MHDPHSKKSELQNLTPIDNTPQRPSKEERLSASDMLSKADAAELRAFLRRESQRNKYVAMRLKAHLIDYAKVGPAANKYSILLNEIVREGSTGPVKLTKREEILLADITDILLKKAAVYASDKYLRDLYAVSSAVLEALHRYLDKRPITNEKLRRHLLQTYEYLYILTQQTPAPELIEELLDLCADLCGRSYYKIYDITSNCISLLVDYQGEYLSFDMLSDLISTKIEDGAQRRQWLYWLAVLYTRQDREIDRAAVPASLSGKEAVGVAELLITHGEHDAHRSWLRTLGNEVPVKNSGGIQWAEWQLQRAIDDRNSDDIIFYTADLVSRTGNYDVLEQALLHVDDTDRIASKLEEIGLHELAVKVHAIAGNIAQVETALHNSPNLEVLVANLEALVHVKGTDAYDSLRQCLIHYVSHNAGPACFVGYRRILNRLKNLGHEKLARKLEAEVEKIFPGRFSMPLAELDIS